MIATAGAVGIYLGEAVHEAELRTMHAANLTPAAI
jgi:hypothetical protein